MLAIMKAESYCNHEAYNGSNTNGTNDRGLFQINSIHVTSGLIGDDERTNPTANIDAAHKIWKGSGYTAWSAYNNNSFRKFL